VEEEGLWLTVYGWPPVVCDKLLRKMNLNESDKGIKSMAKKTGESGPRPPTEFSAFHLPFSKS